MNNREIASELVKLASKLVEANSDNDLFAQLRKALLAKGLCKPKKGSLEFAICSNPDFDRYSEYRKIGKALGLFVRKNEEEVKFYIKTDKNPTGYRRPVWS